MKLNQIFKGLMVALPVLVMTACSSTDDAANADSMTNDNAAVTQVDPNAGLSEQEMQLQKLREASTIFFKFDNSEIAPSYENVLAAHAAYLSSNPSAKVTIEGHADERGTPEYNIALGERRAEAVSNYIQALGVQANQISIVSYGEEKPLEFGQTEAAYSQNRRAVLVY
ncbi:MAG: peptidoglycan-associated lipoprotein Pal [Vibrio sp.]